MARELFDRELHALRDRLIVLASEVEENVVAATRSLKEQDELRSRRIIAGDEEVNQKQISIEQDCLTLIARQQPTAGDLRFIAAVMAISNELERINDYAKGIAKINLLIGPQPQLDPVHALLPMAEKSAEMLGRSLQAFLNRDVESAHAIYAEDDVIDEMYNDIYRRLVNLIVADAQVMDQATHLLWAAHNLERTADRVSNICERVVFMATGELVESLEEEAETPVG